MAKKVAVPATESRFVGGPGAGKIISKGPAPKAGQPKAGGVAASKTPIAPKKGKK